MREVAPYTLLAAGYDVVMEHVDYEDWAAYVAELLERHAPDAASILELACGTGSLAVSLQPDGPYDYLATDASASMLAVAEQKADFAGADIQFAQVDFTGFRVGTPVDVVLLLYDGINYVLEPEGIRSVFRNVHAALRPGGLFIFDLSTPVNSINNARWFEDEGEADAFRYRRRSVYDPETRLHVTSIEMSVEGDEAVERHCERAYDVGEIVPLLEACGFEIVAVLDGFTHDPVTPDSERAHFVCRRPRS